MWQDNSDVVTAQTGDIFVSAFQEPLEADGEHRQLWGYCLRIENNSDERIRLLKKDFCITDSNGHNYFANEYGFHGELPDLEPGEYFEFEDTIFLQAQAAVLYGACVAQTSDGREIKIKLPVMPLTALDEVSKYNYH